jgi:hypothetical protein
MTHQSSSAEPLPVNELRLIVAELERTTNREHRTSRPSPPELVRWDAVLQAAHVLLDHGMPPAEVHKVLMTEDPEIIRRHMELHRERLEERLEDQRLIVGRIEALLVDAIRRRIGAPPIAIGSGERSDVRKAEHVGALARRA